MPHKNHKVNQQRSLKTDYPYDLTLFLMHFFTIMQTTIYTNNKFCFKVEYVFNNDISCSRGRGGELISYWQYLDYDKKGMANSYFAATKKMEECEFCRI